MSYSHCFSIWISAFSGTCVCTTRNLPFRKEAVMVYPLTLLSSLYVYGTPFGSCAGTRSKVPFPSLRVSVRISVPFA